MGGGGGRRQKRTDRQAGKQTDTLTDRQRGEREEGESKNKRMLIHVYKQQAVPGRERERERQCSE